LKELKAPVGFFLGGAMDQASPKVSTPFRPRLSMQYKLIYLLKGQEDYGYFGPEVPVWQAVNKQLSHMGTYSSPGGGLSGKSAIPFLEWQMRGDATAKARCTDKNAVNSLFKDGWEIKFKNFK
jgi:hypothetical protein